MIIYLILYGISVLLAFTFIITVLISDREWERDATEGIVISMAISIVWPIMLALVGFMFVLEYFKKYPLMLISKLRSKTTKIRKRWHEGNEPVEFE